MKYQSLPPRAIIAAAVVLPVAQASLTHWMVFGEQAFPVRSELAVEDARKVIFESRSSELIVRPTAEFGTSRGLAAVRRKSGAADWAPSSQRPAICGCA